MLRVPVPVELTAVVFGALSGALHAVNRKADVVGTFSLAMSTGVGGGILRDILIGVSPPVALSHALYLPVVAVAALLAMLFAQVAGATHTRRSHRSTPCFWGCGP